MKAIISNKIYMTVEPSMYRFLEKELTHTIPSYNEPEKFITIKNIKVINYNIAGGKMLVAFPVGRTDLIPKTFEVVDKRAYNYISDFPEFKFELRSSQQEIYDDLDDNCIINAKVGYGKAQPKGSLVRVPKGWKPIEEVMIGDTVITPNNFTAKVTGKYAHYNKPIYKVTFGDGRFVEACGEHLWLTINGNNIQKVLCTEEILNSTFYKNKRMYIPLCSPISEETTTNFIIHPYVLGVILGDGSITHKSVKVSSADIEVIDKVRNLLPEGHYITKIPSSKYDYSITSDIGESNIITNELRRLKLQGTKSLDKFIPDEYIYTTLENKLHLISGLLDTDGTISNGNKIDYYTISEKLAEGFKHLIFSIGGMCTTHIKKSPKYTHNGEERFGEDCYVLSPQRLPLTIKEKLFTITRKLDRVKPGQYDESKKLRIDNIEYVGNKDCWCISLDSEDKLYLTNNYIVTHNTFTALAIASKLQQKTLVVVHTVALRNQWEKEVVKTLGIKPGVIGSGKFNTDSAVVVANIQSLIKHVGRINREFGTLILDEMHHVSSPTFSKVVDAMFSRYKIGLSGTIERKDQKHVVFKDYFGSKIYKPDKENTMTPEVHVVNSGIYFSDRASMSWAERVTVLKESPLYKNLVIALADSYAREGHKVIVVSERVEFLKECSAASTEPSDIIIGEVKDRDDVIKRLFENKISQIWGTQSLVSEGLSINPLSCLILATPLNNMPLLEQLIGRIIREYPDKLKPVIVDIRLEGNTVSKQYNNRIGHYMKEGYELKFIK